MNVVPVTLPAGIQALMDRKSSRGVKAALDPIHDGPGAKGPSAEPADWGQKITLERREGFSVDRYEVAPGRSLPWRRSCECTPYMQVLEGEAYLGPACGRFASGESIPVTFEESISIANTTDRRLAVLVAVACAEVR